MLPTPPPSKIRKPERNHEENQERAYIAASRRSDRSLEARLESARRASEIHKRRTGRSLRITEQDVLNEELYEEEVDDQDRRPPAYFEIGSTVFTRPFPAGHVAMRSALDQTIQSYAQRYPGIPTSAYNQPAVYPSPYEAPRFIFIIPKLHPKLAASLSLGEDLLVLRRFSAVQSRLLLAKQDEIQKVEKCLDEIGIRDNPSNKRALLEDLVLDYDASQHYVPMLMTNRKSPGAHTRYQRSKKKSCIDRLQSLNSIPSRLIAEKLAYMDDLHELVPAQENTWPSMDKWADKTNLIRRILGRWLPASDRDNYRKNESPRRRSSKSDQWLSGLCLKTLFLTGLLPSVLASESKDALLSPSTPLPQEIILPTNNKLGWPFEPGWPPFDGWPFVVFGILLAAATFVSAMFKKTNTALVSGIGMAVSSFLGFTILNDKTTTPTVSWTMVVIELFYASFYAVVHWRKYNMAEGCQLTVLALTFMIALILITAFSDSNGQGISKEIVACFVPPSFSISLFLCCSWSALFGPACVVPYHGKLDKSQGVPVTCECQQHAVCGCDEENRLVDERQLTSGATEASTSQGQEQERAPQPAVSDVTTDEGRFVETFTQGGTLEGPYGPRPPVRT